MRLPLLCLLLSAAAAPAQAQVTTNDQALDALKPAAPAAPQPPAPRPAAAATPSVRHATRRPAAAHPAHPARAATPPPKVPLAPPVNPVIAPPPFVMPAHPRPKPSPVPVKADAIGTATAIPGGSRITFGPGVAAMNQATHDAIDAVATQARGNPLLQVFVTAWAPGTPDDASPARTLSLERALAARAILINDGIASDRILAVAKGMDGVAAGPPDRLEITAALPKQTPAGSPVPAPPLPAPLAPATPAPKAPAPTPKPPRPAP